MKIDPTVTSTPSSATSLTGGAQRTAQGDASTQAAQAPATPAATSTAASTGSVNISNISTQLNASFAGNTGDINTQLVAKLKTDISNGNLSYDSSKIAQGLIDTVHGLLREPQEEEE